MADQISGFPYHLVRLDSEAQEVDGTGDALVRDVAAGITDLVIFCHGWNNDEPTAKRLYELFFSQLRTTMDDRRSAPLAPATVAVAGVLWPSMRWPDEAPAARAGGAASTGEHEPPTDGEQVRALGAVYPTRTAELEEMAGLLEKRPDDEAALHRFQELMAVLVGTDGDAPPEDAGEQALVDDPPDVAFARMAAAAPRRRAGGAQGIGDRFTRLWDGAKDALRQATYWEMKKRAGVVGEKGLGSLIGRLHQAAPEVRIHLVGHSFGARVVSFALAGLPAGLDAGASPVKTLFLLQGAFSHFSFAADLPFDHGRAGALAGKQSRVDGPLLVSHSLKDSAVGRFYPLASLSGRQDAAAANDELYRWGAMGHDGAQAVGAAEIPFGTVGSAYGWTKGAFTNLDGNSVIVNGAPPSGAHSDIVHEQIAWALLSAAGIAGRQPAERA